MEARQPFSRLGWALFAQMAVMLAAQWGVLLLAGAARPGLLGEPVFLWAASVLGAYGLGIPAACLVLRGTAAPPAPARRPLGPVRFAALLGRLRGAGLSGEWGYPAPHRPAGAGSGARRWSTRWSPSASTPFRSSSCWPAHRPCGGGTSVPAGCCCAACGPYGEPLCAGGLRPLLRPVSRKSEPVFLCLSSGAGAGGASALHRLPMAGCPPPRAGQPLFHPLGLAGRPVVVTGVLMLAGAMVPFRLIPALLAVRTQSAEHGGAFSPAPACSASARCPCPWRCLI